MNTIGYLRLLVLMVCFCLLLDSNAQTKKNSLFTMRAESVQQISISQTFSQSTTITPFGRSAEIYGLDLTADISLDHYASLVRVILLDNTFNEYMVYEAYPRISGNNVFSLRNMCEETFVLNGVVPRSLKLEIIDGSITLHGISVSNTPFTKIDRDFNEYYEDIREEQINEKIIALNTYISENGMNWKAAKTSISHLPYREKKYLVNGEHIFNWQGFEYYADGVFEVWYNDGRPSTRNEPRSSTLRKEFDWRNRHGANKQSSPYYDGDADGGGWCTKIATQSCSHCWAFCPTGTLECLVNVWFNQHINVDLSEQDAASCSGGASGDCKGGNSGSTVRYIVNTGITDEECYKYTKKEGECSSLCTSPKERIKASASKRVTNNVDEMKKAIIQNGPITSGVKSMWHFMCLIGFTEDASGEITWIFKNSNGTKTGEKGFSLIKVKLDDFYGQNIINGPFSNLNNLTVQCADKDNDGYYNWGIGPKPSTCPQGIRDSADGNDNDPNLGPFDENFNEKKLMTSIANNSLTIAKKLFTVIPGIDKGTFYVDIKNGSSHTYTIELIDLFGRTIFSEQRKTGKNFVHVDGLSSRTYIVRVISDGMNYYQKIITQ